MTKSGIHAFARVLSGNLTDKGIRVNDVGPMSPPLNPPEKQAADVSKFGAKADETTLLSTLEAELSRREIPFARRGYAEITKALQPVVIKHYHQLIATCIKHIRASHLTLDMLLERAKSLHDKERAKLYARAVWAITEAYSRKLDEAARIDFDSMIAYAARFVETGRYRSPFSLILVDEFQGISEPRANLIKVLKQQNTFAKSFAVGDDWQSIYRFAGSTSRSSLSSRRNSSSATLNSSRKRCDRHVRPFPGQSG